MRMGRCAQNAVHALVVQESVDTLVQIIAVILLSSLASELSLPHAFHLALMLVFFRIIRTWITLEEDALGARQLENVVGLVRSIPYRSPPKRPCYCLGYRTIRYEKPC